MAVILMYASACSAENLKSSDLMNNMTAEQRHWWYAGAYTTLGHAVQINEQESGKAECVWNWYFKDPELREKQLEKSFSAYPDHSPTAIILALLKRDCGVFAR